MIYLDFRIGGEKFFFFFRVPVEYLGSQRQGKIWVRK